MSAMYDRFSSKEDAPGWHQEMFMQGFSARTCGKPLDGPNTPRANVVGEYASKSWRAGWCDADAGLAADKRTSSAARSGS